MILSGAVRSHFLDAIYRARGKTGRSLLDVLADTDDQLQLVRRAKEMLDPSDKYYRRVRKALDTLEDMVSRLMSELSKPSKPLEELLVAMVKYVFDRERYWTDVRNVLAKHFDYLSQLVPIDDIIVKGKRVTVLMPTHGDLNRLARHLKRRPDEVILRLSESMACDHDFREYILKLTGMVAKVDMNRPALIVGGSRIDMDYDRLGLALLNLQMLDDFSRLVHTMYSNIPGIVSPNLGVQVNLDIEKIEFDNLSKKAKIYLRVPSDVVSALFGTPRSGKLSVYVVAKVEKTIPDYVYLLFRLGNVEFGAAEKSTKSCWETFCVATAIANSLRNAGYLKALDELIHALTDSGFSDIRISHDSYFNVFYVSASHNTDMAHILSTVDANGHVKQLRVSVPVHPTHKRLLTPWDVKDALSGYTNVTVFFVDKHVEVSLNDVPLNEVPVIALRVPDVISKLAKFKKGQASSLDPVDATALYLFGHVDKVLYLILERESRLTRSMIATQMLRYARRVADVPPSEVYRFIHSLHSGGRLTIDDEGYLRLEGRRLVDIVARYFGGKYRYSLDDDEVDLEKYEEKIVSMLVLDYSHSNRTVAPLFANHERIPDRVVNIILGDDATKNACLRELVGSRDLWNKLSFESKSAILLADSSLLKEAEERGWSWVSGDKYLQAKLHVVGKRPSEVTEVIVERFPEFIGSRYEAIRIGGEVFVKVGNCVMQVKDVQDGSLLVHGTVSSSRVGIVVRAKTVAEAAKAITENLVDAFHEFNDVVEAYRGRAGATLRVDKYVTPAFSVPQVVLELPNRRVVVPLQPRFADIIEKHVERQRATSDEEKAPA